MAGYRRVNYYELCRLCTSSEGTKMHIFREEGRRRSLPSKIQTCLPLQVQEEDSLPKIICSSCVEKLESYYEFRESCINAEAMLESYFTSLRYSDDLTREGKVSVYVKDEPPKKKDEATTTKVNKIPVTNVTNINSVTSASENNSLQPSAIQILTDAEGNRLTQYKVQVQGGIPSLVPYGNPAGLPLSLSIPTLQPQTVKPQTTSSGSTSRLDDGTQTSNESNMPPPPPLVAAVTITPHSQDLLQQISLATKDRNALSEILKMKNINFLEAGSYEQLAISSPQIHSNQMTNQVSNLVPAQIRIDPSQLNQLINSNLQINLSQLQTSPNNKNVLNINRNIVQLSQNQVKIDNNQKLVEEREVREQKLSTSSLNGSQERLNNPIFKTNIGLSESEKQGAAVKFESNGEVDGSLDDDLDDGGDDNQQSSNSEENLTYECETCSKTFKRKEHLFQHKKSHSGERPFGCTTCGKAFSRKEHLLRHTVSHTGQKLYACDVCQKSFSRKDNLHKHKKTHGINGPHVCETCGKSFVVKHYYVMHKAQHENFPNTENSSGATIKHLTSTNSTANPLPFKCDLCTKSFSTKQYLNSHRLRHRSKIKQEDSEEVTDHQPSSDITIPQPTILTSFPATTGNLNLTPLNTQLTTINPNALLAPNIIHSSTNVVQIGNNSYLCTPNVTVTQEILEQYRRLHTS